MGTFPLLEKRRTETQHALFHTFSSFWRDRRRLGFYVYVSSCLPVPDMGRGWGGGLHGLLPSQHAHLSNPTMCSVSHIACALPFSFLFNSWIFQLSLSLIPSSLYLIFYCPHTRDEKGEGGMGGLEHCCLYTCYLTVLCMCPAYLHCLILPWEGGGGDILCLPSPPHIPATTMPFSAIYLPFMLFAVVDSWSGFGLICMACFLFLPRHYNPATPLHCTCVGARLS